MIKFMNKEKIAIVRNDLENVIEKAFEFLEIGGLIKPGDRVLIKPNVVRAYKPEEGITTHPFLIKQIIRWAKRFQPREIVVAEGSAYGGTLEAFEYCGMMDILREEQVYFLDLNQPPYVDLPLVGYPLKNSLKVSQIILDHDVLINVPVLKKHGSTGVTLGMKNLAMALPPIPLYGQEVSPCRPDFHNEHLSEFIVAVNKVIKTHLCLIDGIVGQSSASWLPENKIGGNFIIAGTNVASVDAVGARMLGFKPQNIVHLQAAYEAGIGEIKLEKMVILGEKGMI
jgi:uncharacterized protein (DUF362 family)